jgi:hypothetical protein
MYINHCDGTTASLHSNACEQQTIAIDNKQQTTEIVLLYDGGYPNTAPKNIRA